MGYIFQIVETEQQPVLSVQKTTSAANLPNIVGEAYGTVLSYLAESGKEPLGPAFIAYYNMDMEHLEVEIGFPIMEEMEGKGDVRFGYG